MVHLSSTIAGAMTLGAISLPFVSNGSPHSAVGMDYRPIEKFLEAQQWEAAAAETQNLIFAASLRSEYRTVGDDLLTQDAVNYFPCQDLATINSLWNKYSQGRFSFSIQNRIRQQVTGPLSLGSTTTAQSVLVSPASPSAIQKIDMQSWQAFSQQVGWQSVQERTKGLEPTKPIQRATDVPEGAFPLPVKSTGDFGDRAVTENANALFGSAFLNRVQQCGL
ncbi:GUN4 domain-containing protein [Alkalinema pantanalense CENA528]|uniref:GUN4 domain-containing protein n=1 Tax=Alkalinema pantanalense TaxID=1620705 RepID=UPI003D700BB9